MAFADIRTEVRDFLADFDTWLAGVTVLEWVLLGIALALVLWAYVTVRAATQLGPIVVAPVEGDGATPPSPFSTLTARLRQAINDVGLRPPPDVPAGAPEAGLLSAIKDSPIPQANWIVSLISAFPRPKPISYKLTTTLDPSGQEFRYWLCPTGAGTPLLDTVVGAENAMATIPKAVLMHVSKEAVDIFPPWAQWSNASALQAYLDGLKATHDDFALDAFALAIELQPDNAMVRLRQLNLRERMAASSGNVTEQAAVLRGYLDLVMTRAELIEARYRGSTLAGVVADAYAALDVPDRPPVIEALGMHGDVESKLRDISKFGLRQALAVLRPWFVPIVWHRPRYAAEPRGYERRRLVRTLRLSKHCQFARRHPSPRRRWTSGRLWCRKQFVRLRADRSTADGQVSYNAGCFFALIGDDVEAYRFLARALGGGGYGAVKAWMPVDPDLASLDPDTLEKLLHFKSGQGTRPRGVFRALGSIVSVPVAATLVVLLLVALIAIPWSWAFALLWVALHQLWVIACYFWRSRRLANLAAPSD